MERGRVSVGEEENQGKKMRGLGGDGMMVIDSH